MFKLILLFSGCSTATNCIFIGQIQNLLDIPHDLFFFSLFDTLLGFSHFCPLWHRITTTVTDNHVLIDSSTNTKILPIIIITILYWKVYKEITLLMCLVLVSVLTFSRWKVKINISSGPISVSFLICTSGKDPHNQAGSTNLIGLCSYLPVIWNLPRKEW